MATAPAYTSVPRLGVARLTTADTSRTAPTNYVTVLTGVGAGTILDWVTIMCDDPADSMVSLFLHDGTTFHLFDDWDLSNPAAASTTVAGYRESRTYPGLRLPSASWSLRATVTVALTAGGINVFAGGGDLT